MMGDRADRLGASSGTSVPAAPGPRTPDGTEVDRTTTTIGAQRFAVTGVDYLLIAQPVTSSSGRITRAGRGCSV